MREILILCSIAIPWIGAVVIWLTGDKNSKTPTYICSIFLNSRRGLFFRIIVQY